MDKESSKSTPDDELFASVPADFPRTERVGAVPGAQPKLLATQYKGQYYSLGCSPPEVYERWVACEDLAQQLAVKSQESKLGKRSHMTEAEILHQYFVRLVTTKWTSLAEARWVMSRTAAILFWPAPTFVG